MDAFNKRDRDRLAEAVGGGRRAREVGGDYGAAQKRIEDQRRKNDALRSVRESVDTITRKFKKPAETPPEGGWKNSLMDITRIVNEAGAAPALRR